MFGVRSGKRRRSKGAVSGGVPWNAGSMKLLADMQAYHGKLANHCAEIQAQMDVIANVMSMMGSRVSSGASRVRGSASARIAGARRIHGSAVSGPRPKGESLKDYILRAVKSAGSALSPSDIAASVTKAGYKTASKNFPNQISMALAEMVRKRLVKKLGRGEYGA